MEEAKVEESQKAARPVDASEGTSCRAVRYLIVRRDLALTSSAVGIKGVQKV